MRDLDTSIYSLIFAGSMMGIIHGITVWLTTDINSRTASFLATGNVYAAMYISLAFVDGIGILITLSAIWWYPKIERMIISHAERKE